jgi:tetratricopeptide (TPR) repeat protein
MLKLLAEPGTRRGDQATYWYAEQCLRFHREGERRALAEAKRAFADLQKNGGSRWGLRGRIGLWRVMAAAGKSEAAVKGLDRFLGQNTKCERAAEAAYFLGRIQAGARDDLVALRRAQRSLAYAARLHESVGRYRTPVVSMGTIEALLRRVKRRIWALEAGKLKVLFDRAEKLRRAKRFDAAIGVYRQIREEFPGHDLTELSGVRVAQCLFGKKQPKKAVAEGREFVALDPLGAYRGHAHLLIGDIHLEHFFDVAACEPEFRCILDPRKRPKWVDPLRRKLVTYRKLDPKKTPPAKEVHKTWKGVLYAAHERAGILEYVRRRFDLATKHFAASARLKPVKGLEKETGIGMAEVADLCRKRKMPLDEVLLGQGDDRTRLVLFLGAVYMKGWRDNRAMKLFARVYGNEFGRATLDQRAYARARMGEGYNHLEQREQALKVYAGFESPPLSRSIYAADALLQKAALLSRRGERKKAIRCAEVCFTKYPNTVWADWAMYQRAFFAYCSDDKREARKWLRAAVGRYPRSLYRSSAETLLKRLERKHAQ